MIALPSLFLMSGAVAIGIYLGILYLRRERPRRLLLGGHILMGMGGLEQVALLIHGSPSGVIGESRLVWKRGGWVLRTSDAFGLHGAAVRSKVAAERRVHARHPRFRRVRGLRSAFDLVIELSVRWSRVRIAYCCSPSSGSGATPDAEIASERPLSKSS